VELSLLSKFTGRVKPPERCPPGRSLNSTDLYSGKIPQIP